MFVHLTQRCVASFPHTPLELRNSPSNLDRNLVPKPTPTSMDRPCTTYTGVQQITMDRGRADSAQLSIRWSTLTACESPRGDSLVIHFASCVIFAARNPHSAMPPRSPNSGSRHTQDLHGLAQLRVATVPPHSRSPWLHQAQGLHVLAQLRVYRLSPDSGSCQSQGLHDLARLRVTLISLNSASHHTQSLHGSTRPGSPLFHQTQGLHGSTKIRGPRANIQTTKRHRIMYV